MVIKEGASAYDIGKTLESKGLIEDALVFWVQEKLSNYSGQLKPGTYLLSTAYTPTRIMGILAGDARAGGRGIVIVEERMRTFINSLDTGNTPFLEELEKEALESEVPVIRREMQSFIKTLSGCPKAGAYSGGGDSRGLLHTSYVRIWSGEP